MASRGLNRVMLIGYLGRDPSLRYTPAGTAVATFSVAVNRPVRPDSGGQDAVDWFAVVVWRTLAETCADYLTRGNRVYVEGRLRTRQWEDTAGQRHQAIEVIASELLMLGGGRGRAQAEATDEPPAADQEGDAGVPDDLDDVPF